MLMKRILTLLLAVVVTCLKCYSQEITSTEIWSGALSTGVNELNVSFVIKTQSDGMQICAMDVPEQGAKGIPVELVKNDYDSLNVSIPMLRATYKGRKVSAERVELR